MMTDDADIDRITKRTESVTNDIKELANIAAECPNCSRRFKEYLQSRQRQRLISEEDL
jgi:bacterioferritin-associated ferredoxin